MHTTKSQQMKTPKETLDHLRTKLKAASKGEPETWGFVALFMQMIDETEKEITETDATI